MNYIRQLNSFWEWVIFNNLSIKAVAFYLFLLHINNKNNWQKKFQIKQQSIALALGFSDRHIIGNLRGELESNNLIKYIPSKGSKSGTYIIAEFVDNKLEDLAGFYDEENAWPQCKDYPVETGFYDKHDASILKGEDHTQPQCKDYPVKIDDIAAIDIDLDDNLCGNTTTQNQPQNTTQINAIDCGSNCGSNCGIDCGSNCVVNLPHKSNSLLIYNKQNKTKQNNIIIEQDNDIYLLGLQKEYCNQFLLNYPAFRRRNLGRVLEAWKELPIDIELYKKILTSLNEHKVHDDWLKDNGKWIPSPVKFLKDKCWADDLSVAYSKFKNPQKVDTYISPDDIMDKIIKEK